MAGLGLDAKMLANTDEELKAKIGWLAYVKAIALALRDKNQLRLKYKLDAGSVKHIRAHTVIVGNCGTLQANVLLLPEAAVDDGQLDIVLLRPEGFLSWAQIFTKIVWENGVLSRTRLGQKFTTKEVKALNYVKGQRFTMTLNHPEPIELDGDEFGEAVAIRTWVVPNGLTDPRAAGVHRLSRPSADPDVPLRVLGAAGRPVRLGGDARREAARLDEFEGEVLAGIRKQPRSPPRR